MALKLKLHCQELCDADQWEHHLVLFIVKNFLKGGGRDNDLWKAQFLSMVSTINKALIQIAHMDPKSQWTHMASKRLLWHDVLEVAKAECKLQFNNKEWPPAKHATDSKGPPHKFAGGATAAKVL